MPFDVTNPADLSALKSEIENDPVSQGYRSPLDLYAAGATVELLKLLRQDSAGGETNSSALFSGEDLLAAMIVSPGEYAAVVSDHPQSALRTTFIEHLLRYIPSNAESFGVIPQRFQGAILSVFTVAAAPTIRASLIAEATGPMRREEVLFGDDISLTRQDIQAALTS